MERWAVTAAHRKFGIGLNLRRTGPEAQAHSRYSSGIKLINCLGFGIPSISNEEAGYTEIGDGCTLYCDDNRDCGRLVAKLQTDADLYEALSRNALARGQDYSIDRAVAKYRALLTSL